MKYSLQYFVANVADIKRAGSSGGNPPPPPPSFKVLGVGIVSQPIGVSFSVSIPLNLNPRIRIRFLRRG